MKVIAIEMTGVITDVSAMVECKSNNEDIIKVSMSGEQPPLAMLGSLKLAMPGALKSETLHPNWEH